MICSCSENTKFTQLKKDIDKLSGAYAENTNSQKDTVAEPQISSLQPNLNSGNPNEVFYNSGERREDLVNFSKQFIGTPYLYGSTDPKQGLDCSGFINHVYKTYSYNVPRSSKDFVNFGRQIDINEVKKGDLLLFTGTEQGSSEAGHIGIVITANGMNSEFIHSSSGKANGVTTTLLSEPHYTKRFIKAISVID
nr:C40 family peptidase [Chryseobacterium taklimakanense]